MNIKNLILKLKGYPIDLANKKLKEIQFLCNNDVVSYQDKMKWEIFNFHCKNNLPYFEFIGSKKVDNKWCNLFQESN
jgi:hypothetical protein